MLPCGKSVGLVVQFLWRDGVRVKHQAITKGRCLPSLKRVVERWLLRIEHVAPQRIRGKQPIAARMPVRWIADILGMVEDRDGCRVSLMPLAA